MGGRAQKNKCFIRRISFAPSQGECVCVCPPLDKGFSTFHRQGGKASGDEPCPMKLSRWRGSTKGRFGVYLPHNFCTSCLPHSSACCFMVLHVFHPTNRFLSAADRRLAQLCSRVFRVRLETMFNHTVSADFSTLRFFAILPIGEIELTEYKLSKCVPLSRPTRVLSVIPVTGALMLHGKASTTTHHHSPDSHRKALTPSQNQLTYRPPGQKTVLEEYIGFQPSDFGSVMFTSPSHVCVSMFCHIDAVTLSSAELKFGH